MNALLDHPGRVRIVVEEADGAQQLGLLYGLRSRHYSAAATARLAYEAEDLTPLDTAAVGAVAGASGGDAVQQTVSTLEWTPVLSTEIAGVGHMTHTGSYRVWARVKCSSFADDASRVRLVWGVGDASNAVENTPARVPFDGRWYMLDLGAIRLDPAPAGEHRWVGHIQAKADTVEFFAIDKLWLVPVDDVYGRLTAELRSEPGLTTFVARDDASTHPAGPLTGKTAPVGGDWTFGGGDTDDFEVNGDGSFKRASSSDTASRIVYAATPTLTDAVAQIDFYLPESSTIDALVVLRWVDASNYVVAMATTGSERIALIAVIGGTQVSLAYEIAARSFEDRWMTLRAAVFSNGVITASLSHQGSPGTSGTTIIGYSDELAAGGALESGKVGFGDFNSGAALTRKYDNWLAWTPEPGAVIHAGRSLEIRTDGCYREAVDGASYAPVVPVGNLPRLPPSGIESRPVELFLKTSRGDFDQVPDSGIDAIVARVYYRPSWLQVD